MQKQFDMKNRIIKTNEEYDTACERVYEIIQSTDKQILPNTKEGEELELLSLLIENYEKENFSIEAPSPIEAIKFRMEQMGYNQNDLANIVGLKSRASEILNRKRKLSLEMIRQLHEQLNIPTDVLIQAY